MKKVLFALLVVLSACSSNKPTEPYSITNVAKTPEGAKMDVQLKGRLTRQQMLDIAGNIRNDSSHYEALDLQFLLPGNSYKNSGGIIVYAMAGYPKPGIVTAKDTVRDYDNKILNFQLIGFTPEAAKHLLSLSPSEMAGKPVLGKFIDDAAGTISIIYDDKKDGQYYIIEMDADGNIVSKIQPMAITHNGIQKLIVSQRGDYMTVKDSILTMYSIDDPEKPFRSVKEGI
ncbi:hypothetical protein [Mucilaginibacter auburnensis]|uniref:Lipoprotein n=1 Tax=Mucilaginibacter auburnensis TaxID=1457233 RepID=A0A2H9VVC0_9SPHI|nr:hypothetical protein [Mucilaginibacter auburnensis]PJJ84765.1 hypothetical protein CLV57_1786 [Mucilaginibacter auburnensis]